MRLLPNINRRPELLLMLMAAGVPLSFATWGALLNNFAIGVANFDGASIGILQSMREVPGFLALGVVVVLLWMREQTLALISLALLGLGTALTGFFPSLIGLTCTTLLMSLGFHYYETMQTSLTMQWVEKARAPETFGKLISVGSLMAIVSYGLVWLAFEWLQLDFAITYVAAGCLTLIIAVTAAVGFPHYPQKTAQHKKLILRRRYWLYYALTFMSGARRQIFIVFAGFLLVEKFAYSVQDIALLFLFTGSLNVPLAPRIGRLIARVGERKALAFEYLGLVIVFSAYAFVSDGVIAGLLYVVDHLFFALAIAINTYFQKIADSADIASTAAVGFTINHIAAVVIPVGFGFLWLISPAAVFLCGAVMAVISLLLSLKVPRWPAPGNEVTLRRGIPLDATS
jgi:predicted MFS family arabinose efflux permease